MTDLLLYVVVSFTYLFIICVFCSSMMQTINVLTSDGYRLYEAVLYGTFSLCVPVLLIICIIYACIILGYTALIGTLVYLIFIPIQVCCIVLIFCLPSFVICWTVTVLWDMFSLCVCVCAVVISRQTHWSTQKEGCICDRQTCSHDE